jgi:hypothetical protein
LWERAHPGTIVRPHAIECFIALVVIQLHCESQLEDYRDSPIEKAKFMLHLMNECMELVGYQGVKGVLGLAPNEDLVLSVPTERLFFLEADLIMLASRKQSQERRTKLFSRTFVICPLPSTSPKPTPAAIH